jgi:hypothetical protein
MKEPLSNVSKQIKNLIEKNGSITLFELEQTLDTSYNLIFLAIDNMVTNNEIILRRCGKDYFISNSTEEELPIVDTYE